MKKLINSFVTFIRDIIFSPAFVDQHKRDQSDFSRNPILSFKVLIVFLINMLRASIQTELDNFFRTLFGSCVPMIVVTNSAFCQARKKIKHTAFLKLDEMAVDYFYTNFPTKTWHGFRLIAVDGSTIVVPKNDETIKYFGLHSTGNNGDPVVLVRISQAFDVLNHITVAKKIDKYAVSELDLLIDHIQHLKSGDLCLLDRGYPAFWLFKYLLNRDIHFCARLTHKTWKSTIEKVKESNVKDKIVEIIPTQKAKKRCANMNMDAKPVKLRVLIINTGSENEIILITSLLDKEKYPYKLFDELYHDRWPVEESYKQWKRRIEIENFSGISVENIMQDFYANAFTINFTSIIAFPVHDLIKEKTKKCIFEYQINWTAAFSKMKVFMVVLIFFEDLAFIYLKKLIHAFLKNILPRRPGRQFVRKRNFRKRFYIPYKPII